MDKPKQPTLFEQKEWWEDHWQDMPEYKQDNLLPWRTLNVHFSCRADMEKFSELIGQPLTGKTQSVWYPKRGKISYTEKVYIDEP